MTKFLHGRFWMLASLTALLAVTAQAAPDITLPLDENKGTVVADQAGHNAYGVLTNGATWAAGVHGSAVGLDPTRQQCVVLNRAAVNTQSSFTVSAWVKVSHLGSAQTFISQDGRTVSGFSLEKRGDDNRFVFTVPAADASEAQADTAASDFAPTPGLWYQVTGVCDRAAGNIRLYADGTTLASAPLTASWQAAGRTVIGRGLRDGKPADFADGAVDEVRIFPRALSDAQVAALHRADQSRFLPRTFAWANPIYFQGTGRGADLRDPCILKDGGVYYLVYTMWPFANYTDRDPKKPNDNSSPGIAIYASRDLKVWKFQSWVVKSSDLPEDCPYRNQFWAPELHKINGRYYVIFGGSNWLAEKYNIGGHMGYYQFVGVADKVTGPYRHFTHLAGPGVDTSLFQDDDGKTYVIWPRNEIHPVDLSQIDQDRVTVGPMVACGAGPDDFKAIGHPVPETMEGPYLIKHSGTYYLFFAETYRGPKGFYDTAVATAKNLAGPWLLDPRWRIFPGGHQALFVGPDGRWWTSYRHEESDLAPWLSIDPVDFDSHGQVQVDPSEGPQSLRLGPTR